MLNPNAEINVADDTWLWIGKVSGSYRFPKGILGSFNYDFRSGDPLARQVLFRGGTSIPTFVMNVEPIGSLNLPAVKQLDLRAAKQFDLGRGRQFEVHLDCFNALNSNAPTAINVRSGSSYLFPTAIPVPRIMQIEGRFTF